MQATTHRQAHEFETYIYGVVRAQEQAWYAALTIAKERAVAVRPKTPSRRPVTATASRSGECGGDLPPCCVLARESGGDPRAENPVSTASGLWQFIDGTWNGFGGYSHASYAPASVQNEKARLVWNGGRGASNWYPRCW